MSTAFWCRFSPSAAARASNELTVTASSLMRCEAVANGWLPRIEMLSAEESTVRVSDACWSTCSASMSTWLVVLSVVPALAVVVASEVMLADTRSSAEVICAWSASSRSSRLRAANAP